MNTLLQSPSDSLSTDEQRCATEDRETYRNEEVVLLDGRSRARSVHWEGASYATAGE